MKLACMTIAYHEERLIKPFLQLMLPRVDEVLILNSTTPWQGEPEPEPDTTATIARDMGATVIEYNWPNEHEQRNAGLDYLSDYDWVIVLDPDEFITTEDWNVLMKFLESNDKSPIDAYVTRMQHTLWKSGYEIMPHEDYTQCIAVRPTVRFFDKRCVNVSYTSAPIELWHASWARTDSEVRKKINHYSHAHELDPDWYSDVWLSDRMTDLHPLTPTSLKEAVPVTLPKELEDLHIWPTYA